MNVNHVMKTKQSAYSAFRVCANTTTNQDCSLSLSVMTHGVTHVHVPLWYGFTMYHIIFSWKACIKAYIPGN